MRLCIKFEVNQVDDSGQFLVFLNTWPVFSSKYKLLPANVFRGIVLCCRGSSDRAVIYRQAVALPKCRAVSVSLGMSQSYLLPSLFFRRLLCLLLLPLPNPPPAILKEMGRLEDKKHVTVAFSSEPFNSQ